MGGKPKQLNDRKATIWVANDVNLPPFHGGNTGSNPEAVTITLNYISIYSNCIYYFKSHF